MFRTLSCVIKERFSDKQNAYHIVLNAKRIMLPA